MKILVLCTNYPTPIGGISLAYIRTRNLYYKEYGIDVTVLNFCAVYDYTLDNIQVLTLKSYNKCTQKYDVLICHAPNIRNHFSFLRKNHTKFNKIIFFFHGHEVLNMRKTYPKPYSYVPQKTWLYILCREYYDWLKLRMWHFYFPKLLYKSHFVFVSEWLYKEFLKWVKIKQEKLYNHIHIIHNGVGSIFERKTYNKTNEKLYDFITIRPCLDTSKYAIDIVNSIAKNNLQYKFLIVGKGDYFSHNSKATNIIWVQEYLSHDKMVELMNMSKCALMPTKNDTQGVVVCEMATFGIPVITSDIPICREIFNDFDNVALINNDEAAKIDISIVLNELMMTTSWLKNSKYFATNTSGREIELLKV